MPTYTWNCGEHSWDVVTSVASRDEPSACPSCGKPGKRGLTLPRLSATLRDWNAAEFNPGLGCVTYGAKDRERKAKARGLEEVGTTAADTIHKTMDETRAARREAIWSDAAREKLYE